MKSSIAFLLGAGFSAPMGYPIGNRLNELLLNSTQENIKFGGSSPDNRDNDKSHSWFSPNSNDKVLEFCQKLMHYFKEKVGYFDYEKFYDFFKNEASDDPTIIRIAESIGDFNTLIDNLDTVYNQLVLFYLKDKHGENWYAASSDQQDCALQSYRGITDCLQKFSVDNALNVHTLNHDLFFEHLVKNTLIEVELSDGFDELDSPYYGEFNNNGRLEKCRLSRYTGNYFSKIRLFKLHGSLDQAVYYTNENGSVYPEVYLKTRAGINIHRLYKENLTEDGTSTFKRCTSNSHADFLTGTTSKIKRYGERTLYKLLFEHFQKNLENAEKLIIIGYGGRDTEINRMLQQHFDYKNKPSFVIDPIPGEELQDLSRSLNAKPIAKKLEDISMEDFVV